MLSLKGLIELGKELGDEGEQLWEFFSGLTEMSLENVTRRKGVWAEIENGSWGTCEASPNTIWGLRMTKAAWAWKFSTREFVWDGEIDGNSEMREAMPGRATLVSSMTSDCSGSRDQEWRTTYREHWWRVLNYSQGIHSSSIRWKQRWLGCLLACITSSCLPRSSVGQWGTGLSF